MSVPGGLHELVERFDRDRASYRSGAYNEAQARVDFINPLLGLLGWDVDNRQGLPEAYREVVYEDRVKVGGGTKAPDYGFYASGRRRFFLEAKKPSVDIHDDIAPAVQLLRYAWSARLPLSLLTDFEELAVYDCRPEPQKGGGPAVARLEFLTYDRYPEPAVWDWDLVDLLPRGRARRVARKVRGEEQEAAGHRNRGRGVPARDRGLARRPRPKLCPPQ